MLNVKQIIFILATTVEAAKERDCKQAVSIKTLHFHSSTQERHLLLLVAANTFLSLSPSLPSTRWNIIKFNELCAHVNVWFSLVFFIICHK